MSEPLDNSTIAEHLKSIDTRLTAHADRMNAMGEHKEPEMEPATSMQMQAILDHQIAAANVQGRIEAGIEAINKRLDIVNGRIGKAESSIGAMHQPAACELRQVVENLGRTVDMLRLSFEAKEKLREEQEKNRRLVSETERNTDDRWKSNLKPLVIATAMAIGAVILFCAEQVKGWIKP